MLLALPALRTRRPHRQPAASPSSLSAPSTALRARRRHQCLRSRIAAAPRTCPAAACNQAGSACHCGWPPIAVDGGAVAHSDACGHCSVWQPSRLHRSRFIPPDRSRAKASRRWSADGWLLWRRGSTLAPAGGLLTPSYGASQAGVVLRYRLAPGSALRPAAYLRATAALNGSRETRGGAGPVAAADSAPADVAAGRGAVHQPCPAAAWSVRQPSP